MSVDGEVMDDFEFTYSRFRRIGEAIGFTMSMGLTIFALLAILRLFTEASLSTYLPLLSVLIAGAVVFFALSGYSMFPDIKLSDKAMSIHILWHWYVLSWDRLQISREYHGLLVSCSDLPIGYLIPSSRWGKGRAFFINKSIERYDVVVSQIKAVLDIVKNNIN